MSHALAQYQNFVPVMSPANITTTATNTAWVDCKTAHSLSFLLHFGSITAASADQAITVTVEAATGGASTSAVTIPFTYRLSGTLLANTWGAVTAATSATGASVATTDDGKILWIEVDPSIVAATEGASGYCRYVSVLVSPDAGATATNVGGIAIIESRFLATTMQSST